MKILNRLKTDAKIIIRELRDLNDSLTNTIVEYQDIIFDQKEIIINLHELVDEKEAEILKLQQEIERLKEGIKFERERVDSIPNLMQQAKSEAIKEFADKYEKAVLPLLTSATLDKKDGIYACLDILKEMVRDDK